MHLEANMKKYFLHKCSTLEILDTHIFLQLVFSHLISHRYQFISIKNGLPNSFPNGILLYESHNFFS